MNAQESNSPELRLVERPVSESIELNADDLKQLWVSGILNDTAYVALILKLEGKKWHQKSSFNFEEFAIEWQYIPDEDDSISKPKTLKTKSIRDAIDKLVAAELASAQSQLTLQLTW